MTKIIVDQSVRAKLCNLDEPLELCDSSGRTLGHYVPTTPAIPRHEPDFSQEEVERRRAAPGGLTLDEIWKRLEPK